MRRWLIATATMVGLTFMGAAPALAQTSGGPTPTRHVAPHQYFAGEVNGEIGSSVLSVSGCAPAVAPVPKGNGHPLAGQTVSARYFPVPPPGTPPGLVGFTGRASALRVDLAVAPNPMLPLVKLIHVADLVRYDTPASIPDSISLPCGAKISALFLPVDGGSGEMSSDVNLTVTYPVITLSQPVAGPGQIIGVGGGGFAPNSTYTVEECSEMSWIAPLGPCSTTNTVNAMTDANGSFTHPFQVAACPTPVSGPPEARCFVGVPEPAGIDTISLVAASPLIVELIPAP